ncbi:hypothetical protein F2Q68_00009345 [Brassica cretica]|uniref:Uncharacterized protein n=1 Tax=Brassica cretica TaxID=69181 RepID=A0A8S9KYY4_BRACR|nr:hypothetical protein F2Q68_00009345 [Brassica cretica]
MCQLDTLCEVLLPFGIQHQEQQLGVSLHEKFGVFLGGKFEREVVGFGALVASALPVVEVPEGKEAGSETGSFEVTSLELSTGLPLLYIFKDRKFMRRGSPVGPTEAGVYAYTKRLAQYRQKLDETLA